MTSSSYLLISLHFAFSSLTTPHFVIAPERVKPRWRNLKTCEALRSVGLFFCVCLSLTGSARGKNGKCKRQDSSIGSPIREYRTRRRTCSCRQTHTHTPVHTLKQTHSLRESTRTVQTHTTSRYVHSHTSWRDRNRESACLFVWLWVATVVQ